MSKKILGTTFLLSALFFGAYGAFAYTTEDGVTNDRNTDRIKGDVGSVNTSTCIDLQSNSLRYQANDAITNGEVTTLQNFLNSIGLLKTSSTGYFGLSTLTAVKMFQKRVGINPTGYVGLLTKTKIKEASCVLTEGNSLVRYAYDPLPPTKKTPVVPESSSTPAGNRMTVIGATTTVLQPPKPVACTMETKLCSNGTLMQRDMLTCAWIESSCFASSTIKVIKPGAIACTDVMRYCPVGIKPNPNDPCPCITGDNRYDQQSQQQVPPKPVVCTMEAKLCPNGTMMARDLNTCAWITSSCNATTTKVTPPVYYGYDPLPPVKPTNVVVVSGSSSAPAGNRMTVIGATTTVLQPPKPVACTTVGRLCSDGSIMPRDANCVWHPEKCPASNGTVGGIQCSTDPFSGKPFCGPSTAAPQAY